MFVGARHAVPVAIRKKIMNEKIIRAITMGEAGYVRPYKEPKVWGVRGIGEYWYGAGGAGKDSQVVIGKEVTSMSEIIKCVPEEFLGKEVVRKFGRRLPLVKILTPKGRLSVQFHDTKNELWIVTGVDKTLTGENPSIILGFSPKMIEKYGEKVKEKYREVLERYGEALNVLIDELESKGHKELLTRMGSVVTAARKVEPARGEIKEKLDVFIQVEKDLEEFYNYHPVTEGDVVPVPAGTLHALCAGLEVVEPQIAGLTQSLEDGATYPVRYYFPGYERPLAQKKLDLDRIGEMNAEIIHISLPEVVYRDNKYVIERLPGKFEDKGLEVRRITLEKGAHLEVKDIMSFHNFVAVIGTAKILIAGEAYRIPNAAAGGEMLIVPASAGNYRIESVDGARIIDTFTPV